jgi:hypothetical protein
MHKYQMLLPTYLSPYLCSAKLWKSSRFKDELIKLKFREVFDFKPADTLFVDLDGYLHCGVLLRNSIIAHDNGRGVTELTSLEDWRNKLVGGVRRYE